MKQKNPPITSSDDEFGLPIDFYKHQVTKSTSSTMSEDTITFTGTDSLDIQIPEDAVQAAQPVFTIGGIGGSGQDHLSFTVSDALGYHPDYYNTGQIEVWDFIADQELDFFAGNVVKYVSRAGRKSGESRQDDLQKAKTYIQKMIDISA